MDKDKVTICVVNYKTPKLTKLCLRSIRKYTHYPYELMVVDNDSQDESTEYLRSLNWINLIERKDKTTDASGGYAHGAALDLGLENCNTKYFMSMHSDTFVHKTGWLTELMEYFKKDDQVACVGGGKVEITVPWRQFIKRITDYKKLKRKLFKTPDPLGKYKYYNRTVCSIYRTDILKKENLTFLMEREKGFTVGKKLYFELIDRGFKTVELPDRIMTKYLWHLAHATQVMNKEEFNLRNKTNRKINRLIKKIMNSPEVKQIMKDDSLDKERSSRIA